MKRLFNFNTGYFLKERIYHYDGKPCIGYILCKGYILFGLSGYDKIDVYVDKQDAEQMFFTCFFH